MDTNFFWPTEKAAPVSQSGFGIIPAFSVAKSSAEELVLHGRIDVFVIESVEPTHDIRLNRCPSLQVRRNLHDDCGTR